MLAARGGRLLKHTSPVLLLLWALFLFLRPLHASGPTHYILAIDSGSSGTRLYAFKYTIEPDVPYLPLITALPPSTAAAKIPRKLGTGMYDRVETQPGMGELLREPVGIRDKALQPLLAWAEASIPSKEQGCSPILLLATGGARSLPEAQRETLLKEARQTLAGSTFHFQPEWAKVISGTLEGAYSFVALAYSRGLLQEMQGATKHGTQEGHILGGGKSGRKQHQSDPPRVLGILDLGGSSLEVTTNQIISHDPSRTTSTMQLAPAAVPVNVTVGDAVLQLSATTYRHCGLMDTWDRSIGLLLEETLMAHGSDQMAVIRHPCLHRGYSAVYQRLHPELAVPGVQAVHLIGDPDERQCSKLAHALIKPCTLLQDGPLQGDFVGISGFYVVPQFLRVATHASPSDPNDTHALAARFRSMPWDQVQSQLGHHVNREKYGLWGTYVAALTGPHGFNLDSSQITIGTKDMSWPLGAAIVDLSERLAEAYAAGASRDPLTCRPVSAQGGFFSSRATRVVVGLLVLKVLMSYSLYSYLKRQGYSFRLKWLA